MAAEDWSELVGSLREITTLENVRAVISWDQQTNMPQQAAAGRGEQTALPDSTGCYKAWKHKSLNSCKMLIFHVETPDRVQMGLR